MADVSRFELNGTIYPVKDTVARDMVNSVSSDMAQLSTNLNNTIADLSTNVNNSITQLSASVDSDIDDLSNRVSVNEQGRRNNIDTTGKIICIGDSYLEGWTPDGTNESFGSLLATMLGKTVGTDFIIKYYGGAGFAHSSNGNTFGTALNNISVDNSVTLVIVAGGYNDGSYAHNVISDAIRDFCPRCRQYYPNAQILIADIAWCNYSSTSNNISPYDKINIMNSYNEGALRSNAISFPDCWKALVGCNPGSNPLMASDEKHPNLSGQNSIAFALYQFIKNGYYRHCYPYNVFHLYENIFVHRTSDGAWILMNNTSEVTALLNSRSGVMDCTGIYAEFPIKSGFSPSNVSAKGYGSCQFIFKDDNGWHNCLGQLGVVAGHYRAYPIYVNSSGHYTASNISNIQIANLSVFIPAIFT